MDRGAWWATVQGVAKESDRTEATEHAILIMTALIFLKYSTPYCSFAEEEVESGAREQGERE